MGDKAAETTHNISNAFGPGDANERTVQLQFKKFCKGDERLEEKHSGWLSEINDQLRVIIKAILLQLHEKLPKNSTNHSVVIQHLKQIGKVKKLNEWVSHELTTD